MRNNRYLPLLLLPLAGFGLAAGISPKIVGGEDVTEDYPWMAGLHLYYPAELEYTVKPFCGGSLIAPGWIVSAAHCFTDPGNGGDPASYSPVADRLIVRLDSPDLNIAPEHYVQRIIAHPDYGVADGSDDSDIVLIQLDSKVAFDTVSLADSSIMSQLESSSLLDDVVQIIGWGIYDDDDFTIDKGTATGNQPDYLQGVRLDYLPFSNKKCRTAWGGLTTNMICAWEPQPDADNTFGEDSCFGDSGGPLLLPANTTLSAGVVRHDWLLGATSFGSVACNSTTNPGVYTRLANFDLWIEDTTAGAGDALIDVVATLDLATAVLPGQSFDFVAGILNNSRLNNAGHPVIEVTAANTALTPANSSECTEISDGWRCTLTTLVAGEQSQRTFSATWLGPDDSILQADVRVYASQNDYRIGNNRISGRSDVTELPDPALAPIAINSNRNGRASITVTASNLSPINSIADAQVIVDVPVGLSVTGFAPCALSAVPSRFVCELGTMAPQDEVALDFDLQGIGTFLLPVTLQSTSGDIHPGDTSKTLEITLKRSRDSGSAALLIPLILLLYRRRN